MRADAKTLGGGSAPFTENSAKDAIIPVDNADSWIVGSDRMDRDAADATKNARAFFNKAKAAFRAGVVNTAEWDDANVGSYSSAMGTQTKASGFAAHAQNQLTVASGSASHAEGVSTTASGTASHAEGNTTAASGTHSHAEGNSTTASGGGAHAEGTSTIASGSSAHAEGTGSQATGNFSSAGGRESLASRYSQRAFAAGAFAAYGDSQAAQMVVKKITTDATPVTLRAGGDGDAIAINGAGINVLTVLASRAYQLKISTVARRTDVQGEAAGWTWEGVINRDTTGSAYIVGTPITAAWGTAGAAAWDLAVSINTTDATSNYVAVIVTGEAGKTIRWVAKMEWTEVGG